MESSEIIFSLGFKYVMFTTDLVANDSLCIYPTTIHSITLSADEMLRLASFISGNRCLRKIGFSESSLLYVAKQRKIAVAVGDSITQCICDELGIETIKVQRQRPENSNTSSEGTKSQTTRRSIFKIAACL